jgi:hypothetical protein
VKIEYKLAEQRSAQGVVELTLEQLDQVDDARSEGERRAVMRAAVWEHARMEDRWVYGDQVDFGVVPDDEEEDP